MSNIRKCYNSMCANNVDGCYCDGCDIIIDDSGVCVSFNPMSNLTCKEKEEYLCVAETQSNS